MGKRLEMKKRINLLFGIHCHQPAGNFDFVFEQVYQQAYLPFVEVIARHPQVKITLHYTGGLLEWITDRHPEWFEIVRPMVESNQVELLGGGFYEPILAVIPEADRRSQVTLLSDYLMDKFGQRPRGMWLAERVWESSIVPAIVRSGIEYVLVDDFHFICAGLDPTELYGYYLTEEEGYRLGVFPIDAKLRYLTPFQSVEKSLEYLAEIADETGQRCAIVADDGEKYGSWPDTYDWVYRQGWLDQFLTALEQNQDWIKTMTYSEVLDTTPPLGRIYLPTASYFEMGQWSLSAPKARALGNIHRELEDKGRLEEIRPFLRGGIWKNFLVKYPESNLMHKKMLYLADRVKQLPESEEKEAAQKLIYKAQTNDAYWHGVFGGLYLPHLRQAIYRYLIIAERCLDAARLREDRQSGIRSASVVKPEFLDLDKDGREEVMVATPFYTCGVTPHNGGQVYEFSIKPLGVNLLNTLRRHYEHYHENQVEQATAPPDGNGVQTIHSRETESDQALRNEVYHDWYARTAFIDHFLGKHVDLKEFARSTYPEQGDFVNQTYLIQSQQEPDQIKENGHSWELILRRLGGVWEGDSRIPIEIVKSFTFLEKSLIVKYSISNASDKSVSLRFGVECNLAMPSCGGPGGKYRIDGQPGSEESFASWGEHAAVKRLELTDDVLKGTVSLEWDQPATLWKFPVETVSQSESGWEKTYQSSMIMPIWYLELNPGEAWPISLSLRVDW